MPLKYSLSYRKINIAKLDAEGNKQYTADGTLITEPAYKAYASAQSDSYGDSLAFAQAVARKNQFMGRSDILAVLTNITEALKQNILAGMTTVCGELGSFRPTISSKGCPESDISGFQPLTYIKKAYANWTKPKALADMKSICTFEQVAPRNVAKTMSVAVKNQAEEVTLPQSPANKSASETGQIGGKLFEIYVNDKSLATITPNRGFYEPGTDATFTIHEVTEGASLDSIVDENGNEVFYEIEDGVITINIPDKTTRLTAIFEE